MTKTHIGLEALSLIFGRSVVARSYCNFKGHPDLFRKLYLREMKKLGWVYTKTTSDMSGIIGPIDHFKHRVYGEKPFENTKVLMARDKALRAAALVILPK